MGTNINRQKILGRGTYAIYDGVGSSSPSFDPATDTDGQMQLWLRARASDTLQNTPPFIEKWDDTSSGTSIQYISAGGLGTANRPSWNGTDEVVEFDGNDYMDSVTSINLNTATDGGWAIAITTTMNDWTDVQVVIGDDNSNNGLIKFASPTGIQMKLYNPTTASATLKGVTIDNPASLVDDKEYVFIWNMNAASNDASIWIDGVKQTAFYNFAAGHDFHSLQEIGAKNSGGNAMTGKIREYMVYKGELSDTDIGLLNTYMHNKII